MKYLDKFAAKIRNKKAANSAGNVDFKTPDNTNETAAYIANKMLFEERKKNRQLSEQADEDLIKQYESLKTDLHDHIDRICNLFKDYNATTNMPVASITEMWFLAVEQRTIIRKLDELDEILFHSKNDKHQEKQKMNSGTSEQEYYLAQLYSHHNNKTGWEIEDEKTETIGTIAFTQDASEEDITDALIADGKIADGEKLWFENYDDWSNDQDNDVLYVRSESTGKYRFAISTFDSRK